MKNTDKFLIGIVIGVILLVVVAFGIAFTRPEPTYQPEDTPEGVVNNYLLALRQEEYDRAYGYLSPDLHGYPKSLEKFIEDIHDASYWFQLDEETVSLDVSKVDVRGATADITVQETRFYQGGLFDSGEYKDTFELKLKQDTSSQEWKIIDGGYSYWAPCWEEWGGCK
jgi:hypothetical protein